MQLAFSRDRIIKFRNVKIILKYSFKKIIIFTKKKIQSTSCSNSSIKNQKIDSIHCRKNAILVSKQ